MVNQRERPRDYNYSPNHQHKPMDSIRDFKKYRMYIIKQGETEPKELVFGSVEWGDNIDTLGLELRVTLPKNIDDRFLSRYNIAEIGDAIVFKNLEDIIFEGMIEDLDEQRNAKVIVCYDFAHLLNKTAIIKQFTKMNGKKAIESICSSQNIPIGKIDNMKVSITKIYKSETVSDIIKDIIKQEEQSSGKRFNMEVRGRKLYIEEQNNLVIKLSYKPAANVSNFDPTLLPGEITRNDSITDMKNEVIITYEEKKKIKTVAKASDEDSIKKYGKRTHIESVTKEEVKNAQTIANNKLRELTGIKTDLTVTLLGDDKCRSGRVIELNNETFKLKGRYRILNCNQIYENNNRKMILDLEGI